MLKDVIIYTDGACSGNQCKENIGGWGAILLCENHRKEIYGGAVNTSNQRMELTACLEAFKVINQNNLIVSVYSDSAYLVNGMSRWIIGWKKRGWQNSNGKEVANKDLWYQLDRLRFTFQMVNFVHVLGHSGNELNERADYLARKGVAQIRSQEDVTSE